MTTSPRTNRLLPMIAFITLLSPLLLLSCSVESFSPSATATAATSTSRICSISSSSSRGRRVASLAMSSSEATLPLSTAEEEDDDEMEWVEEEFELLTERDFFNTEWKIGTLMENKPKDPKSIDTTWVRLVSTEDGENKAIWGDKSQGKWNIDVPSQFFSISKETFGGWFGKQIWAGTIEDFYFLEGTVRGWSPISPASVDGQWQGIRLGVLDGDRVTADEKGEAPWFMAKEEVEEADESEGAEKMIEGSAEEESSVEL